MKDDRLCGVLRRSRVLLALATGVVAFALVAAGPSSAATVAASPAPATPAPGAAQHGAEIRAGKDVVVPEGSTVPSVVAFGGDVTVDGHVDDAVVAFGGRVVVDGSVGGSVVAFGGDVTVNGSVGASTVGLGGDVVLGQTAVVGSGLKPQDASVVVLGGSLTRAPGAQVHGVVKHSPSGIHWGDVIGWGAHGLFFSPFLGASVVGWTVQTAFFLVLALVTAALLPGGLRRVQGQLRQKPWASLGWGALAFWVVVPAAFLALLVTLIGLLLWLPLAVFVLLAYFFGSVALVTLLAQRLLSGLGAGENLMLSVVVGVVGTTTLSRIPVAGVALVFVMVWAGAGGVILAAMERRRERREEAAAQAALAAAAGGGPYPPSAGTAAPGAVITPIVQTSPRPVVPEPPATPQASVTPQQPATLEASITPELPAGAEAVDAAAAPGAGGMPAAGQGAEPPVPPAT
jgi:hypothetical protein